MQRAGSGRPSRRSSASAARATRTSAIQYVGDSGTFAVVPGEPTENLHIAFPVADDEAVAAFHGAALAAGFRDNGAFVLGADGTNVEAVCHHR